MVEGRLKIAFVDYVLEPDKPGRSGLSDIVWDMASELTNQGHEVHVVASYHTTQYPDARISVHNFETPPMGYRNVVGNAWLLYRAARIVKSIQPDIVHAPEYVSTAVFSLYGVSSPMVLTVPGNIFHKIEHGNSYEWYFTQVLKWAAKKSAASCSSVIAISKEMKLWWEMTGSPPDRTPWIPLGVNTSRFYLVSDARAQLGIPNDKVFLLYVGRFSTEKGLLDLLDALASIKSQLDPSKVQVTLIGKGRLEQELGERIEQEGLGAIVALRPWVAQEELKVWYSAASALLLPSHSEGFSRTIPEAMICGTPVIGTRITGTEDHIEHGVNGCLVHPKDAKAIAEVISNVVLKPEAAKSMGHAALSYAQQHLTWPAIVERIVKEVYIPVVAASAAQKKRAEHSTLSFDIQSGEAHDQ